MSAGRREEDKERRKKRPIDGFGHKQRKFNDEAIYKDHRNLETLLADISLVPVTERPESPPDLSAVEVFLTTKELHLSPAFQKLRIALKKGCKVKRYDIVPLDLVKQLLVDTEKEIPCLQKGTTETVDFIHMDDGFNRFYLQFKLQKDRLNLINLLLTDLVRFDKLKRIESNNYEALVGKHVAVRQPGHDVFVRGYIEDFAYSTKALVNLVDYGLLKQYEVDSVFQLPVELADMPPLCFPAYLYNFCPDGEDRLGLQIFNQTLSKAIEIRCQIESVYESDGPNIYGVCLFAVMVDGETELDVGDYIYGKQEDLAEEAVHSMAVRNDESLLKDLASLMYSDHEVDISDYSVSANAHCSLKCLDVLEIVSPEHLIVQHVPRDGESRSWYDAMQQFYNDPQLCQPFRIKTSQVFQNRCYVWFDPKEKRWNRVRVLNPKLAGSPESVLVWALDLGYSVAARVTDMREISPKYCMSTALAFRGHLMHIKPTHTSTWTDDVTAYLRSICIPGKLFHGVVLECREVHCGEDQYAYQVSYGLVLAECSETNLGTAQASIVRKGLAIPNGPCAGRHDLAYLTSTATSYSTKDLMESLEINPSHPKTNSRKPYRKVKSSSGFEMTEVISGWKCPSKPSKIVALKRNWVTTDNHEILSIPLNDHEKFGPSMYDHIPEVMQNRMGYITISYEGMGPDSFYIQMQNKWPELDMMMSDLQQVAENTAILGGVVKPGMIAVARAMDQTKFSFWGRVIISSSSHASNSANAIFVDFGFELGVNLSSVRRLPKYFEGIPPFCRRAHLDFSSLDNLLMPSDVVTWSPQSEVVWKDMICEWGKSDPIYYAWQNHPSGQGGEIQLDQFSQRLNFDRRSLKWCPGKRVKGSEYFQIDQLRDHPWLQHFYSSIGVNIVYEKLENHCYFVTFVPIWRDLRKQGYIVPLVDPKKNPFSNSSTGSSK